MRLFIACALVAACGTELPRSGNPGPEPDASLPGTTQPDGTVMTSGDAGPDAGTLTICQQAAQHSDLTWIQDNVFSASCALSHCHTVDNQAGGLVLQTGMSRDELVNRPATTQSGWVRVVPGQPAQSYLLVAIGGAAGPMPPGGTMPIGAPVLCTEKIDAIRRWIAGGAQP